MQWVAVLNKFDEILEQVGSPEQLLVVVLRVTAVLVENCPGQKHLYNSLEVNDTVEGCSSSSFFLKK